MYAGLAYSVQASENEASKTGWLYDFFSGGIKSVYAEYSKSLPQPANTGTVYYQQMNYSIEYAAADKTYEVRFTYEYRDDWDVLTHNGSTQPPRQQVCFTDSRIQPWTNSNGLGIYAETYERKIQNWMIFKNLDSLVLTQLKTGNPVPGLSGIFFEDELKQLKKGCKKSLTSANQADVEHDGELLPCSTFDFDHRYNVAGISQNYLTRFSAKTTCAQKKLDHYSFSIRNNEEDVVFVNVFTISAKYPMLEGLQFVSGKNMCTVFNFEISRLFSKFVPDLVADPQYLIDNYLKALQESSGKSFARFETTSGK